MTAGDREPSPVSISEGDRPPQFSPRRIAIQVIGFAVGLALLGWCIRNAVMQGGWERLAEAPPKLIIAMLACSLISAVLNGSAFWVTIRPLKRLRWTDLQLVNFAANMLNYAPVRIGAIGRVWYHWKYDGLSIVQIGGWFGLIGYVLVLCVASAVFATLAHPEVDAIWLGLLAGQVALGALAVRFVAGGSLLPNLVERYGRGVDRMVASRSALLGVIGLRLADLTMYTLRIGLAAHILGIDLPLQHVALLGMVALAGDLAPVGRLGVREFGVALAADWLATQAHDVEQNMDQLALVDSATQAAVFVTAGAVSLFWLRRRIREAGTAEPDPGC